MRIHLATEAMVWINGRGKVRLLDVMTEAGIPYQEVGFPKRRYHRPGGLTLICGRSGGNYERIDLHIKDEQHPTKEATLEVAGREPIPFVEVYGEVFDYEKGALMAWSRRRKERKPILPRGDKIFEVLGWTEDRQHLRVKLPHKPETWILRAPYNWMDRQPSGLELRLQELWLDDPFRTDYQHPLAPATSLVEHARKERSFLHTDDDPYSVLAVEEWEDLRQDQGLSVDEALIAVSNGLMSDMEGRGTTYYSGPFTTEILEQYRKGNWLIRDASKDFLERMGALHTIEREMLRAAMRAVASTRTFYARDTFDRLLS